MVMLGIANDKLPILFHCPCGPHHNNLERTIISSSVDMLAFVAARFPNFAASIAAEPYLAKYICLRLFAAEFGDGIAVILGMFLNLEKQLFMISMLQRSWGRRQVKIGWRESLHCG